MAAETSGGREMRAMRKEAREQWEREQVQSLFGESSRGMQEVQPEGEGAGIGMSHAEVIALNSGKGMSWGRVYRDAGLTRYHIPSIHSVIPRVVYVHMFEGDPLRMTPEKWDEETASLRSKT